MIDIYFTNLHKETKKIKKNGTITMKIKSGFNWIFPVEREK